MMGGGRTFLIFICIPYFFSVNAQKLTRRESLQIIIGGGGYTPPPSPSPEIEDNCPPPPPPPCPPPPSPPPKISPPPPKVSPPPPKISPSPPPPPPPPKVSPSPPPPPKVSPSPPPPPKQPPAPATGFESARLQRAFPVIQALRLKIKGDPKGITKTWKGNNICRDYKGFYCENFPHTEEKTLAGVKFNGYNFSGPDLTIKDFIMGLPDLAFFHANTNNFMGSIPAGISKLKYFYELDLSNNKFSGTFPTQVLRSKTLFLLDLRFNTFAGVVPPEVFLYDLDLLFINNNNFIQKLPDNLGSTPALYLTLANNKFTGGIPPSIGHASKLQEVLFLNNRLTGCLPYEIGLLNKATVFDVGSNMLTGPIPHSFQCLKKIEYLILDRNKFYGTVPEAVCMLPKLSNFTLSYNYFTQVGPLCRKLIEKKVLDVKMNCILDLENQRSPEECADFFSKTHSCPDEKSLTYVPCSGGQVESSEIQAIAPANAPTQYPRGRSYGALSLN